MARQRIHNRRAGRGASGTGASWISYSDMMAALLLIFVLILTYSLYQYFTMMETKTKELNDQQAILDKQTIALRLAKDELDDKLYSQRYPTGFTEIFRHCHYVPVLPVLI